MSTTKYYLHDDKESRSPWNITLATGQSVGFATPLPGEPFDDAAWIAAGGTIEERKNSHYVPPLIPAAVQTLALVMIGIWADEIQMPLPADWPAALVALQGKSDALVSGIAVARLSVTMQKANAVHGQIEREGGTWAQVLEIAGASA